MNTVLTNSRSNQSRSNVKYVSVIIFILKLSKSIQRNIFMNILHGDSFSAATFFVHRFTIDFNVKSEKISFHIGVKSVNMHVLH